MLLNNNSILLAAYIIIRIPTLQIKAHNSLKVAYLTHNHFHIVLLLLTCEQYQLPKPSNPKQQQQQQQNTAQFMRDNNKPR